MYGFILRTIANEIAWVIVNSMMTALPKGFRDARNDYVSLVTGVESPLTRRRTCVEETNLYFEYPIAKLYGEKYVSEEARKRVLYLIKLANDKENFSQKVIKKEKTLSRNFEEKYSK